MRKVFGALLLAYVAAACNDSTSPGDGVLTGRYALRTANANAVPTVAISDNSGEYALLAGSVTLRTDNSFIDSLNFRFTPPSGPVQSGWDVRTGSYVQAGDNVTLTYFDQDVGDFRDYFLTWINGNGLTYAEQGLSLIYRK